MTRAIRSWGVVVAVLVVTAAVAWTAPVPAPAQRGDKWEYCEIQQNLRAARMSKTRGAPGGNAAPAPAARPVAVRWVTAEEEVEAAGWEDLGTKMKAPPAKKDTTESAHRVRVLSYMGSQGWELVAISRTGTSVSSPETWTFKRKAK